MVSTKCTTTRECPFSVDKVAAMLLVLSHFLYRSHPSYLPSFTSFRHSFVFRSPSLFESSAHDLFQQPILRFLVHRFLTLSHSLVLASRRYFRLTPLSFGRLLIILAPLAWNVGTILFMAWAGLGCLNGFINSVIWDHSIANVAPVWCDICLLYFVLSVPP